MRVSIQPYDEGSRAMKVWIVESQGFDCLHVEKVFDSKEKAEKYIRDMAHSTSVWDRLRASSLGWDEVDVE